MDLLSQTVQYAISVVTAGSIYAVIGICWSVVYLITKVLKFTPDNHNGLGPKCYVPVVVENGQWKLHKGK